jgi:hypothetical protein
LVNTGAFRPLRTATHAHRSQRLDARDRGT